MARKDISIDQFYVRQRKVLVTRITKRGLATLYLIARYYPPEYIDLLEIGAFLRTDR